MEVRVGKQNPVVLVTGGAGFIGSHLSEFLVKSGYYVVCVDNLLTSSRRNIEHLIDREGFEFVEHDLIESLPSTLDFGHQTTTVDYIFHLASPASPVDYSDLPIPTLLVNSQGTRNVLELARKSGAKVLIASTSEVYGDPEVSPQLESYHGKVNPVGPRSCYDESKRFAEALTIAYYQKHKIKFVITRIFNTFGPRMREKDGRVIPNFIQQSLRGGAITIYGDGSQTRSFCYVTDMIEGLTKAMFSKGSEGEVINIGNPQEMTILELARFIRKMCNSSSELVYLPLPGDDPRQRRPDINKAKKLLDWEPKVGLKEGLEHTIRYFQASSKKVGVVESGV